LLVAARRLSPERLTSYPEACAGDLPVALPLYKWHCAASGELVAQPGMLSVAVCYAQ